MDDTRDLHLGHGFLPRIDARNHTAVERCLTNARPGLFHGGLDLPWAILEGPWALQRPPLLDQCTDLGLRYLADLQTWRYREPSTFDSTKYTGQPYAPTAPLIDTDVHALSELTRRSLTAQAGLGVAAYLIPGFVPRHEHDDVRAPTMTAIQAASDCVDIPARPCIAFVGVHVSGLDAAQRLIDELPCWLHGVYLQVNHLHPLEDSAAKIVTACRLLLQVRQRGLVAIGGRLGSLGILTRALDVDAVDAGLGEGESFSLAAKVRVPAKRQPGQAPPRVLGGRLYAPRLGQSLSKKQWAAMMSIDSLRGSMICRLPCCTFGQSIDSTPARGKEHSLHCRVREALEGRGDTAGMRLDRAQSILEAIRSNLRATNNALKQADLPQLPARFVDNQLTALVRLRSSIADAA